MGLAGKELSESRRREIARGLFEVKIHEEKRSELIGLCPIHGEQNPSFSYNYRKDLYNCLACGATGDLIALWAYVQGYPAKSSEGFKAFCAEFGIEIKGAGEKGGSGKRLRSKRPSRPARGRDEESQTEDLKEEPETIIPESVWNKMPPLPADWIQRLSTTRGWTEGAISGLDLRLWDPASKMGPLKKRLPDNSWAERTEKRIAIPVRDTEGRLVNIRLYLPGASEDKLISWRRGGGRRRLFPSPSLWASADQIWLCEGEPDTICTYSRNLTAVTQTTGARSWDPAFNVHFAGKDVVIAYDADGDGHAGAEKVAGQVARVARLVRIIQWPDFMGRLENGEWPEHHGQDFTDFFMRHGKSFGDLMGLLASARTVTAPTVLDDGNDPRRFFTVGANGRGMAFKSNLLAREILEENVLLTDPVTGLTYRWNGAFWEELSSRHIRRMALQKLGLEGTKARSEDTAAQVADLALLDTGQELNPHPHLICLKNGTLDLSAMTLGPHQREHRITFQFPVKHDPDAPDTCPRWLDFLKETVQIPAVIGEIQEFFGYCLTKETRYSMALLLLGPGSDGKSTALNVLQYLVGHQNCSNVDLSTLDNEFHRATLHGKLLNVATEVEAQVFTSAYFKAIVAGDRIGAAFKHKDPFEFVPFCKLAFSSNRFPRVQDNSFAYFRRMLPIKFRWQVPADRRDPHLFERLIAELDGIFAWAVEGLVRLRERGRFDLSPETEAVLGEYRWANNPVIGFVEECTTRDPDGFYKPYVNKSELYSAYAEYCKRYGFGALNVVRFSREFQEVCPDILETRPRDGSSRRERRWEGIRLETSSR